jgi:hypothetical protein
VITRSARRIAADGRLILHGPGDELTYDELVTATVLVPAQRADEIPAHWRTPDVSVREVTQRSALPPVWRSPAPDSGAGHSASLMLPGAVEDPVMVIAPAELADIGAKAVKDCNSVTRGQQPVMRVSTSAKVRSRPLSFAGA